MKTNLLNTMTMVFLSVFTVGLQAQTEVRKPDQVKLLKQFEGTWQAETGKDTIAINELKTFGTGLNGYTRVEAKGKIIMERRQLFGYDKKTDQFIEAEITRGSDMELWVSWFTSDNIMIGVPFSDRADPEKAVLRVEIEIKSPDSYVQKVFQNGKLIGGKKMNRKKD